MNRTTITLDENGHVVAKMRSAAPEDPAPWGRPQPSMGERMAASEARIAAKAHAGPAPDTGAGPVATAHPVTEDAV